MLQRLQTQLLMSHLLPLLILLPLGTVALLYWLETQFFLNSLVNELIVQGSLIVEFVSEDPASWQDPQAATRLVQRLQPRLAGHLTLLDNQGRVLATADPSATPYLGQIIPHDRGLLEQARQGQVVWETEPPHQWPPQAIDVLLPVQEARGGTLGYIQLIHTIDTIRERLLALRRMVLLTLTAVFTLAIGLSLIMSRIISRPLSALLEAVQALMPGQSGDPVPETGPWEVRQLATAFNRMVNRIHHLEAERRRFLAGLVHEIGRSVAGLKSTGQLLRMHPEAAQDTLPELGMDIEVTADELGHLLDDLTTLVQTQSQGFSLHVEEIPISPLLQEICQRIAARWAQSQIDFQCQLADDLPRVQGDAARIRQIISNLLSNAYKYTPTKGRVRLAAAPASDEKGQPGVAIRASNTGPGIPPEEQERIFEFYYRGSNARHFQPGLGLGLALARQLAEAHHGSLSVESHPDQWTTFTLWLPCHPPAPALPTN